MKVVKKVYIFCALLILIVLRPFAPGGWFGSVVTTGLFVAWIDMMHDIWKDNHRIVSDQHKKRFGWFMLIFGIIGVGMLSLIIVNLIITMDWLNAQIVLDEITLLALLICLLENTFVTIINKIIRR